MPKIVVDKNHCKGCDLCVQACPQKILSLSKDITVRGYFYAQMHDTSRCLGCRICAVICPEAAISVHVNGTAYELFEY
jgi:2-oxoglutarate ferredoxin oxidoreductase subunit delta